MGKSMADENKSPQIENPAKITLEELAYMVKQMRHNQRRCERNPTPEPDPATELQMEELQM